LKRSEYEGDTVPGKTLKVVASSHVFENSVCRDVDGIVIIMSRAADNRNQETIEKRAGC
jgi:hypothetical protein